MEYTLIKVQGAFSFGNAGVGDRYSHHLYDGTSPVYHEGIWDIILDVIVVTLNYRVGPLGFLYNKNKTFPHNNGLYDIRTAIRWVHQQAHHFDGDVNRITLFGLSSG